MKRNITFLLMIFSVLDLFANPFHFEDIQVSIDPDNTLFFDSGLVTYLRFTELSGNFGEYSTFTEQDLKINKYGYYEVRIFGDLYTFIYGSGVNLIFANMDHPYLYDNGKIILETNVLARIKNIKSSSFLSESLEGQTISYRPENLINNTTVVGQGAILWQKDSLPWVEGVEGPGIGETLQVDFERVESNIALLNGYVDIQKQYLYRANNRVKTVKVRSLDPNHSFEIIQELEDVVKFHKISFPSAVDKIEIEIVDVYYGDRWNDTVISGIFNDFDTDFIVDKFKSRLDIEEHRLKIDGSISK